MPTACFCVSGQLRDSDAALHRLRDITAGIDATFVFSVWTEPGRKVDGALNIHQAVRILEPAALALLPWSWLGNPPIRALVAALHAPTAPDPARTVAARIHAIFPTAVVDEEPQALLDLEFGRPVEDKNSIRMLYKIWRANEIKRAIERRTQPFDYVFRLRADFLVNAVDIPTLARAAEQNQVLVDGYVPGAAHVGDSFAAGRSNHMDTYAALFGVAIQDRAAWRHIHHDLHDHLTRHGLAYAIYPHCGGFVGDHQATLPELAQALNPQSSPAEPPTADVAPTDVAPTDVAPAVVAPADVAPAVVAQAIVAQAVAAMTALGDNNPEAARTALRTAARHDPAATTPAEGLLLPAADLLAHDGNRPGAVLCLLALLHARAAYDLAFQRPCLDRLAAIAATLPSTTLPPGTLLALADQADDATLPDFLEPRVTAAIGPQGPARRTALAELLARLLGAAPFRDALLPHTATPLLALALDPDQAAGNPIPVSLGDRYLLADLLKRQGRFQAAAAHQARALAEAPDHPGAHRQMAEILFNLDDPAAALRHADQARALDPASPAIAALQVFLQATIEGPAHAAPAAAALPPDYADHCRAIAVPDLVATLDALRTPT